MVQVDHDEVMELMHGMYGTLDAELELQRTFKRAELTAFLCLLRKAIDTMLVHGDNKGIIDGLCIGPRGKDADLWILIWEELHRFHHEGKMMEVLEHVTAHRKKKEMQHMSPFEKFIAEGHEKADELTKEGARLDGGFVAQRARSRRNGCNVQAGMERLCRA